MKLEISSGLHVFTDAESRTEAIGSVDVVFKEGRPASPPLRQRLQNWVAAPLLLAAMTTWTTLLRGLSALSGSDLAVVDTVAEREEVPVHIVDKSAHDIVKSQRRWWGLANWLLFVQPLALVGQVPLFDLGRLVVGVTAALFVTFLAATMVERNVHMLLELEQIAREEGYDRGVLVTGSRHRAGVVTLARRFEGIELVETETE